MIDSWIGLKLDYFLFDRITNYMSPHKTPQAREEYYSKIGNDFEQNKHLYDVTFGLLDAIDSKTSALLTHVSLLIAVVSIFRATAGAGIYRGMLGLEILSYLIVTLLCLKTIRISVPDKKKISHATDAYNEIEKRRIIFTLASDITIVSTFLLIIIILSHVLLR